MVRAKKHATGFTIVELLIVIVVIGILAAVSAVAYNGIKNRANNSTVQSDMRTASKQFELFKVDEGTYPPTLALLTSVKVKPTTSAYAQIPQQIMNYTYCINSDASQYILFAYSKSGQLYKVDHTNAVQTIANTDIGSCGGIMGFSRTGTNSANIDAGYYNGAWRGWTQG